ncbi:MAG: PKD domain-containing protein [Phycisphaerales bacterium]
MRLRTASLAAAGIFAAAAFATDVFVSTPGPNNLDLLDDFSFISVGIDSGYAAVSGVTATNSTAKVFDSLYSWSDAVVYLNGATFVGFDMQAHGTSVIHLQGGDNSILTALTFDDAQITLSGGSIGFLASGGGDELSNGGTVSMTGGTVAESLVCYKGHITVSGGSFADPTYGLPYSLYSYIPAGIGFSGTGLVAEFVGIETDPDLGGDVWRFVGGTFADGSNPSGRYFVDVGVFNGGTAIVNYTGVAIATTIVTNQPPFVSAGADQGVGEGDTVLLNGSVSDPDNDPVTVTWTQVSGPAATLSNANTLTPSFVTPAVPPAGAVLVFELSGSDGNNPAVTDTVTINVSNINQPPIAVAGADFSAPESSSVALDGTGSYDPDAGTLTYQWSQVPGFGPAVTLVGGDTATPSFVAPSVSAVQGTIDLKFQLVVSDGNMESGPSTVIVHVNNVNDPPLADAGADLSVNELDSVALNGAGSFDPDNGTLTYSWTQILGSPMVALAGGNTASPTFQAPALSMGGVTGGTTLTFELTVTDPFGTSSVDTVNVRVNNVNNAPIADAGADRSVIEGAVVTLDGGNSADTDGDSLAYAWTQTGGTPVTLAGANTAMPAFTAPDVGPAGAVLTFHLSVDDGYGGTAEDDVAITVSYVNHPPVCDAGAAQTVVEGSSVVLAGTASDPDGNTLSASWQQVSGPAVALSGASGLSASFTAPSVTNAEADLVFRLSVDDGFGETASSDVTIHVANANRAPTAQPPANMTTPEATTVTLIGQGQDPDTEEQSQLTYQWLQIAGPTVSLSGSGANVSFVSPMVTTGGNPAASQTLTFRLTVTDPNGATGTGNVDVVVTNIPHAPIAVAGGNLTVNEGSSVTLNGSASSDPDGDPLTFQWAQVSGPTVTLSGANTAFPSFTAPMVSASGAVLKFSLTVRDPYNGVSTATTTVTVRDVASAPNISGACATQCDDDDRDGCGGNGGGNHNGGGGNSGHGNNNGCGDDDDRGDRGDCDDCDNILWPPNHKMVCMRITGIPDPTRTLRITITGIRQDEPTNGCGDGDTPIDAVIRSNGTFLLRAERKGGSNGRVYHVSFTATTAGGSASGTVKVFVPRSKKSSPVGDGGPTYDSTR